MKYTDYKCEAFYKINADQSYLITSYGRHEPYKYNCWVIDPVVHSTPYPTWIQAARMRDAQCSLSSARQLVDTPAVDMTVQMHKGKLKYLTSLDYSRVCLQFI